MLPSRHRSCLFQQEFVEPNYACSPNLFPIKDVWQIIRHQKPWTVEQLRVYLKQEWERIPLPVLRQLVSLIPVTFANNDGTENLSWNVLTSLLKLIRHNGKCYEDLLSCTRLPYATSSSHSSTSIVPLQTKISFYLSHVHMLTSACSDGYRGTEKTCQIFWLLLMVVTVVWLLPSYCHLFRFLISKIRARSPDADMGKVLKWVYMSVTPNQ